jgi:hypothetical protein
MQFLIMGLTLVSVILVSDIALNDKCVYGQFSDNDSGENETNDTLSIPGTETNDTLSIPGTETNNTVT